MIDILVPVLSRPQNAQPVVDSIKSATEVEHRILFICSPEDKDEISACMRTGQEVIVCTERSGRSDYPKKMNIGFKETKEPFLLLAADDLDFEPGWDHLVLDAAKRTKAGVIGTNDLANRQVMKGLNSTHPVVRRSYIKKLGGSLDGPGSLICELYSHNFCERELSGFAMYRRQWVFVPQAHIRHRHPCWGTAPDDDTYRKGVANFKEDQELFYSRAKHWAFCGLTPQEKAWVRNQRRRRR